MGIASPVADSPTSSSMFLIRIERSATSLAVATSSSVYVVIIRAHMTRDDLGLHSLTNGDLDGVRTHKNDSRHDCGGVCV